MLKILVLLLSTTVASAQFVVLSFDSPVDSEGQRNIVAKSQKDLDDFANRYNYARPGVFPSLVHTKTGLWVPFEGGFDSSSSELLILVQATKPLEQRQYENQFYALTEQLFNLTGVTNDVTPKLGFPELQAKIEAIQATDPMAAVNLSLKLLTIDAALKRYDTLWWDDAIQHELPEN